MNFGSGEDYLMHPGGPVDSRTPSVTGPDYMQSWNNLMPRLQP